MTLDRIYGTSIAPHDFAEGLGNWRGDLYNVASPKLSTIGDFSIHQNRDGDYGCLNLAKNQSTYKIVQHSQTPIKIGQYLEVRFRVRVISGAAPKARILAAPVDSSGKINISAPTQGPLIQLVAGKDNFVTAIVGSGARPGVDLAWGLNLTNLYCGLEISGVTGGNLRIDNMQINDVTGHFLSTNSDWVDIRDYGAIGDGSMDCRNAFVAADADAKGRAVFIPEGSYFVGSDLTILSPIRAYGRIVADDKTAVMLADRYNLDAYIDVFKDTLTAFHKAVQALFRYKEHNTLSLCGRCIELPGPVDVQKLTGSVDSFREPRVIENGQLKAGNSTLWTNKTVTATGSWTRSSPWKITNVSNIQNIELGSLIQGAGVGREIYVKKIDVGNKTIYTSEQIFDAAASQNYTFTRFQCMLDFSGFSYLARFEVRNVDFQCRSRCSVMMMADDGTGCRFSHNWVHEVKDRVITSFNKGCNGLTFESNFLKSSEQKISAGSRTSIAISTRMNDMKIRNNHAAYFRHFAFLYGGNHLILSNHFFQGSWVNDGKRTAGIVLTYDKSNTSITGNYVDNCWIEITGELAPKRGLTSNAKMGQISVTGNTFLCSDISNSFRYIKICPNGQNVRLYGIAVTNNTFACFTDPQVPRVEGIDTSNGTIRADSAELVSFANNSFNGIAQATYSPATRQINMSAASQNWSVSYNDVLPFGLHAMNCESVVMLNGTSRYEAPHVALATGGNGRGITLKFSSATSGSAIVKVSSEIPN